MKRKLFVLGVLVVLGFIPKVNALEKYSDYYINKENVKIINKQYNSFRQMGFSDDMIDSLTQETYDSYGKIDIVASKKEEKFFRETTIEGYQNDKTIIEEITENEYINEEESKIFDNSISPLANDITKSHETNYKKLSVYMYKTSVVEAGKRSVVATLTWKKLPAVRSYDIFATRLTGSAEIGPNSFTGIMTQKTTSFIDSSCAFGGEVNHSTTYNSKNSAWNKKVFVVTIPTSPQHV